MQASVSFSICLQPSLSSDLPRPVLIPPQANCLMHNRPIQAIEEYSVINKSNIRHPAAFFNSLITRISGLVLHGFSCLHDILFRGMQRAIQQPFTYFQCPLAERG